MFKKKSGLYKVDKAIFLAAGKGTRLLPLTKYVPKPLIKIGRERGGGKERIIDTLIDAVYKANIKDIFIVVGYKKEMFNVLLNKYPRIKFIENLDYNFSNNISSMYYAKNLLSNAYILESDLYLGNSSIIQPYQEYSNYLGFFTNYTKDWCFKIDKYNTIKSCKIGGFNCYQMVGISYWTEKDGLKLSKYIKELYESKKNNELYWDEVALKKYTNKFNIKLRKCNKNDVIEIDTIKELKKFERKNL